MDPSYFDKFHNRQPYPNLRDYMTVYFYQKGELVGVKEPDGNTYRIGAKGKREWVHEPPPHGAAEKVVDKDAYYAARDEWQSEQARLEAEFREELFRDLKIADHPKRDLLFQKAWDRGHASGYAEVYNVALDLVDLIY